MNRLMAPLLLVVVPLVHPVNRAWSADGPLRYGTTAGEEFTFEMKIRVKHQSNETRFEGITRYRVDVGSPDGPFSTVSTPSAAARMWSDASGQFRVEATFLALEGDQVKLRRTDGREIAVPLDRLSIDPGRQFPHQRSDEGV